MAEAPPLTVKIVYVQEDELRKIIAEEVHKALLPSWTEPYPYPSTQRPPIPGLGFPVYAVETEATVHEDNLNGE